MDGRVWRVEWFGQMRQNLSSPRELEIDVVLRRIGIARPTASDQLRTVRIGMGALCRIPLGSLWRDGSRVGDFTFQTLKSSVRTRKAKSQIAPVKSLKSQDAHVEGHYYFGSLLIPRELGTERVRIFNQSAGQGYEQSKPWKVIIPLAEIARAWFLRDSELTLRLLSYPIELAVQELFDSSQSVLDRSGRSRIVVPPYVFPDSIVTVAMLVLDEMSRIAAGRMVNQLVAAALAKSTTGLEASLPVAGAVPFRATGEWGSESGISTFFVYQLTGITLPKLGEIEWFRSEPVEGPASNASRILDTTKASVDRAMDVRLRVIHNLDPSSGLNRSSRFENAAVYLNSPVLTRIRADSEKALHEPKSTSPKSETFTELETSVSTGVGMSYQSDLPSIRFTSQPPDDDDHPSAFLEAGLDKLERLAQALRVERSFKVRMVCGANTSELSRGIALTQLSADISWALIAQRPRNALCVEVEFEQRFHYVIEVERRFKKEEISSCLFGKLSGKRLSSADIDRVLEAFADARGSWNRVHEPFWRRPLAHKFKDEKTFAQKVASLIRANAASSELNATPAAWTPSQ